jgi:hypothetical protein
MLKTGGAEPGDRLSFFAADLEGDAGWPQAVAGCDYVLHVASPLPGGYWIFGGAALCRLLYLHCDSQSGLTHRASEPRLGSCD